MASDLKSRFLLTMRSDSSIQAPSFGVPAVVLGLTIAPLAGLAVVFQLV